MARVLGIPPGGQDRESILGFAVGDGVADVHSQAERAAVDLGAANLDKLDEEGFQACYTGRGRGFVIKEQQGLVCRWYGLVQANVIAHGGQLSEVLFCIENAGVNDHWAGIIAGRENPGHEFIKSGALRARHLKDAVNRRRDRRLAG